MTTVEQVIRAVEQLVALPDLAPEGVALALGLVLAPDPATTNGFYRGHLARPDRAPFALVELRRPAPGNAAPGAVEILTLSARGDAAVAKRDLDARFGARPPSQIIPEGIQSFSYSLGRYTLHFNYRAPAMTLHQVVLTAPARR